MPWVFACPSCRAHLARARDDVLRCASCDVDYRREGGIWRLLVPGRARAFAAFVDQYETVRSAEGRRVQDPRRLRALPFRDPYGKRRYEWSIRRRSFEALLARVVAPLERARSGRLRVVDLGSGLGWLAYRMTLRGHDAAAVDLLVNDFDGLGVHTAYDAAFAPVQAEFDRLPFPEGSVDLVVYNASFHYAANAQASLAEAFRVVSPAGRVVIMDTPIYADPSSGAAMVREREESFLRQFGFRGDTLGSVGFLTYGALDRLERELDVRFALHEPWYGLRWRAKPWIARLRGLREPARFKLIVGRSRTAPS